jgi:hypothetical protein
VTREKKVGAFLVSLYSLSSSLLHETDHIELEQISPFFLAYSSTITPVSLLESKLAFENISRNSRTPENGHLVYVYSLWLRQLFAVS